MRVLSIQEPYACLIKEKIKYIETRSWKTNYRGELYIHASKKPLTKNQLDDYQEILALLKNTNFDYGCIIAKCQLVDCICMDEPFIQEVSKNNNQFITGGYPFGRYAWIIEDIEELTTPIPAKGNLGIWHFKEALSL